jgi:hypothetical protein
MWTTQLYFHYNDYPLSEARILELQDKVNILIDNITPESLQQLENTEQQSLNDEWHRERSIRLTASKCSDAVKLGHSVNEGSSNAAIRCKKFISRNIWNLDGNNYQSVWMTRGLKSESAAITKYEEQTKQQINPSGLWVNPKFPWLACSPDSRVGQNGTMEIKSLKIFHEHSIESIVNDINNVLVSNDIMKRQCFDIRDNKCFLKRSHNYYYQVQMQLLIT